MIQQLHRMSRPDNPVFLLRCINGDVVLYDFFGRGMVFQLPVNLVRQLLPAVLAKDLCQLFFGQRMLLLADGKALQHFIQCAGLLLVPGIGDFLPLRFFLFRLRFFVRLCLGFIKHSKLTDKRFQLLRLTTKALCLHDGNLLHEKRILLLRL